METKDSPAARNATPSRTSVFGRDQYQLTLRPQPAAARTLDGRSAGDHTVRIAPSILRFMATSRLFEGIDEGWLRALAPAITQVRLERGEALCSDDEADDSIHVVVRGAVRVTICNGSQQRTVAVVGSHAVLPECSGVVSGVPWKQQASAFDPSLVLSIRRSELARMAEQNGQIALNLASLLERRVLWLQRLSWLLSVGSPQQRLAASLIDLMDDHGHPTLDGGTVINLRILQRDLADLIGASRQVVSSAIAEMRRDGILETSHQRIVVRDECRLRQSAERT